MSTEINYCLMWSLLCFYNHIKDGLENRGFKKSSYDDCLFTNGEIIVLFWADDYVFFAKYDASINTIFFSLEDEFLLERDEDMIGFLGLKVNISEYKRMITLI